MLDFSLQLPDYKKAANVAGTMLKSHLRTESCSSQFSLIAGPCAIESYEIFRKVALAVKRNGATALRGGIFKMRMRSDTFQGLGAEAIEIVREVKKEVGLPFISEI